jgi:hypothetical protein
VLSLHPIANATFDRLSSFREFLVEDNDCSNRLDAHVIFAVGLIARKYGPDDSCHLVGERGCGDLQWSPPRQLLEPFSRLFRMA